MSDLRIGDVVWVNVANQKLWWPGAVISTFPPVVSGHSNKNDIFCGTGCDNLMVVKYLGVADDVEQGKLTALRLTDRGVSWDILNTRDLKSQLVPTTMQVQYDAAMIIVEKKDEEDSSACILSDGTFSEAVENVSSKKNQVLEQQQDILLKNNMNDVASSATAMDHGARNIILMNAAKGYDLEGISSSSLSQKNFFQEAIDENSLNLLDHKCSLHSNHHQDSLMTKKRKNVLPWDDYFMSVAFLSAMRSKDPSTQVGACIVNPEKRVVGIGKSIE